MIRCTFNGYIIVYDFDVEFPIPTGFAILPVYRRTRSRNLISFRIYISQEANFCHSLILYIHASAFAECRGKLPFFVSNCPIRVPRRVFSLIRAPENLAERVGFEPTEDFESSAVFKTDFFETPQPPATRYHKLIQCVSANFLL